MRLRRPQWLTRDFLLFWTGDTVSELGNQITLLALPMTAILTLDATPAAIDRRVAAERSRQARAAGLEQDGDDQRDADDDLAGGQQGVQARVPPRGIGGGS